MLLNKLGEKPYGNTNGQLQVLRLPCSGIAYSSSYEYEFDTIEAIKISFAGIVQLSQTIEQSNLGILNGHIVLGHVDDAWIQLSSDCNFNNTLFV